MQNTPASKRKSETDVAHLRRLHYWLSYNRYSIFTYGGLLYFPVFPILAILVVLAVVFAPYLLFVLYVNGKRGWLVTFAVVVGIPTVLAFVHVEDVVASTALRFLPLLTFYFYCFVLRLSVGEWISDAGVSPVDQLWTEEKEKQDGFD